MKSAWTIQWLAYDVVRWQEDNLQQQQLQNIYFLLVLMARTFSSVRPAAVLWHRQKISVLRRFDLGTQTSALAQAGEQYLDAETKNDSTTCLKMFVISIKNKNIKESKN